MLIAREGGPAAASHHVEVRAPFSARAERERKAALDLFLARAPGADAAENELIEAAKKIEAARRGEAGRERKSALGGAPRAGAPPPDPRLAASLPDYSAAPAPGEPTLYDLDARPARPPPGAVARGAAARAAADAQATRAGGPRAARGVDAALAELGLSTAGPATPTRAACGAWLALRLEVAARREAGGRRRSRFGAPPTPHTPPPPPQLLSMLDHKRALQVRAADGGPEGRGKRAHKGRAPTRYE